jgi:hypothetical protein
LRRQWLAELTKGHTPIFGSLDHRNVISYLGNDK